MSLYNLLFGRNPLAGVLMGVLDLTPGDVGRFRDCFLAKGETGALEIHIFTRNGGGNRDDYEDVTETLRAHANYLRDWDDDFDCTYATYAFAVPDAFADAVMTLAGSPGAVPDASTDRFQGFMDAAKNQPDSPDVRRVVDAITPVFEQIKLLVKGE